RQQLIRLDGKAAKRALKRARGSGLPEVQLADAQISHLLQDRKRVRRSVNRIEKTAPAHPPSALWLSSLRGAELDEHLGKERVSLYAQRLRPDHPTIASRLSVRAASESNRDPLLRVQPALLGNADAEAAKRILLASKSPLSAQEAATLVRLQLSSGQEEAARQRLDQALADHKDSPELLALESELGQASTVALDPGADAASAAKDTGSSKKSLSAFRPVADAVAPTLSRFPELESFRSVVLVPMEHQTELWRPRWPVTNRFSAGLELALMSPPYDLAVHHDATTVSEPLSQPALAAIVAGSGTDGALLYSLGADGSALAFELVVFRKGSEDVSGVAERITDRKLELVVFNPWLVRAGVIAAATLILLIGYRLIRGSGQVSVSLKMHTKDVKDYLSIAIRRSRTAPKIGNPDAYIAALERQGARKSKRTATFANKNVDFDGVPAGRYYVHLYGVLEEGGRRELISESKAVKVPRGKVTPVIFNLVPDDTEHELHVIGAEGKLVGATVWLEERPNTRTKTNGEGVAVVHTPVGQHSVVISHGGRQVSVILSSTSTRRQTRTLNFEREYRLAHLADGIEIDSDELEPENPTDGEQALKLSFRSEPEARSEPPPDERLSVELPETALDLLAGDSASVPKPTAEAAPQDMLIGLDRYRSERELGSGAMGVVTLAIDQVLDRKVALKVMSREIQEHAAAADMFMQEAKALAALNHPNIVTVYDQGRHNGEMYIVMEFVEGTTLEAQLEERGKLSIFESLAIAAQLGEALSYSHNRRVIHRDIKPGNVFLDDRNRVKLGDFGLARVLSEAMIRQTEIKGTPLYMAPEQILGRDIDGRADIYAVGCTLYEMLAGRPPFVEGEILYHQMNTEPEPPSVYEPSIPPELDALVLRCLAKDKLQRPATADELVAELKEMV
ncbi:MAG: protein kinase, partial [Deltaproteobacteria bacterium]|nr:protein kinase [Deltaproteobacteria bacterium]